MKKTISIIIVLSSLFSFPLSSYAEYKDNYSIDEGSVSIYDVSADQGGVTYEHAGAVTVTGSSDTNTITVDVSTDVTVTLSDVSIDVSASGDANSGVAGDAAMTVNAENGASVTVELDGSNELHSGNFRAGLETNNGELIIQDEAGDAGSLEAEAGWRAAGIGGAIFENGEDITITGGDVTATGHGGAGIGGGMCADGNNITISGGTVIATGNNSAAGIGGGSDHDRDHSGDYSAGTASNITISGDAQVLAVANPGRNSAQDNSYVTSAAPGAPIGNGGEYLSHPTKDEVAESGGDDVVPDTSELYCTGSINSSRNYWDLEKGKFVSRTEVDETIYGDVHDWDEGAVTNKPTVDSEGEKTFHCNGKEKGCTAIKTETLPKLEADNSSSDISGQESTVEIIRENAVEIVYEVTDGAGKYLDYIEERFDGTMSISVELDEAVLHIYQMRLLKSSGISTVLFKTTDCETVLILDDYIEISRTLQLTHQGSIGAIELF